MLLDSVKPYKHLQGAQPQGASEKSVLYSEISHLTSCVIGLSLDLVFLAQNKIWGAREDLKVITNMELSFKHMNALMLQGILFCISILLPQK